MTRRRPTLHRHTLIARSACAIVAALALSACGSSSSSPTTSADADVDTTIRTTPQLSVIASMFPLEEIVRNVGGERVRVTALVEPGRAAHDAELTARQLDELANADAVFYGGMGFQPEIEKAVDALSTTAPRLDLFDADGVTHLSADKDHAHDDGHNHGSSDEDPHVWLDPANMIAMTRAVVATLSDLDATSAQTYAANGEAYIAELASLGADIDTRLTTCATRTIVTSHDAFGYLAARAKLTTVPIAGVNPEDEPSAKELEAIANAARRAGATTVFFEALLPENLARTVAAAIDAEVSALDPLESISKADRDANESYISLMQRNLGALVTGLGCS